MPGTKFTVASDEGFWITLADDEVTVYEEYDTAVGEINSKLQNDTEGFIAEVAIGAETTDDDVAVTLEQVSWQQVIRDMTVGESA